MSIRSLVSGIAISAALIVSESAYAQDAGPSAEVGGETAVEDIIVTAQRREERLQDVPISITAVTGDSLLKAGVTDTRQLTQTVPGVVFSRVNSSFQPYIRGVGTRNANIGDESNVSLYIDGIYQPVMSSLGFDLIAIKRVEVLRGPQGTLFGRNSTGGLINVITPDPSFTPEGRFVLRGGNYGEKSVQGYFTTGLTDTLAIDISGSVYRDTGFVKDLVRGGHTGDRSSDVIRGKLMFQPSPDFKAILSGSHTRYADSSSVSVQPLNGNTSARNTPPMTIIASNPWESALTNESGSKASTDQVAFQTEWNLGGVTLATTSAYITSTAQSLTDSDATPKAIQRIEANQASEYWSNEVRLLSNGSGAFSWIVGGFLFSGKGEFNPLIIFGANDATATATHTQQEVDSYAVFGEGTIRLGDRLSFIGGVRYTDEKRNYEADRAGTFLVPLQEASFDKITFRASAQYKFTDRVNMYASYSRGFKSGVYNGFATSLSAAAPVRPEQLDAYEIGFKSDIADWLRMNGAIFHYDYTDIQQSARDPATNLVVLLNAATAKVDGAEIEATMKFGRNLNVRGYATYLKARYDAFPGAQIYTPRTDGLGGNDVTVPYDASGKNMIRAPRTTFGVSFDYTAETEAGDIGFAGNVFHSAKYFWDFQNRLTQPAYTLVNGEISFSPAGEPGIRLSIWGRNLTNEIVYSQMTSTTTADVVGFERPRSYGGSVSFTF